MLDPINLSIGLVSIVVPKLWDGLLENLGGELGKAGLRKAIELSGVFKQKIRTYFQDDEKILTVMDADEISPKEIEIFQAALAQRLAEKPAFLNDMVQSQQTLITISPSFNELFQANGQSSGQRIAELMKIAGTLEIDSITKVGTGQQDVLNGTEITETGKVKIGRISS